MDEVRERLQVLFQDTFGDPDIVLKDSMTAEDIDGWDSLAHINLVIAVEKAFGVRFATAEIANLKEDGQNVGSFVELIARKLSQK